jgi:hypothetical protein
LLAVPALFFLRHSGGIDPLAFERIYPLAQYLRVFFRWFLSLFSSGNLPNPILALFRKHTIYEASLTSLLAKSFLKKVVDTVLTFLKMALEQAGLLTTLNRYE